MTDAQLRAALATLPEDRRKQLRDAYYAAAAGLANMEAILDQDQPELINERIVARQAKAILDRSSLGRVL